MDCYYATLLGPNGGSKRVEPAEGMAYPQTVIDRVLPNGLLRGAAIQLLLGEEILLPFQSCDIDAIPITHSLPSPYDSRSFTAQLVPDDRGDAYDLGITYSGKGAYLVRLGSLRLGSFALQLALDGVAVSASVPVLIVCPSGQYENGVGLCASCGDFDFPPRCETPGATLETLDLTPGTWRATFNSTVIRPCVPDGAVCTIATVSTRLPLARRTTSLKPLSAPDGLVWVTVEVVTAHVSSRSAVQASGTPAAEPAAARSLAPSRTTARHRALTCGSLMSWKRARSKTAGTSRKESRLDVLSAPPSSEPPAASRTPAHAIPRRPAKRPRLAQTGVGRLHAPSWRMRGVN